MILIYTEIHTSGMSPIAVRSENPSDMCFPGLLSRVTFMSWDIAWPMWWIKVINNISVTVASSQRV